MHIPKLGTMALISLCQVKTKKFLNFSHEKIEPSDFFNETTRFKIIKNHPSFALVY